MKKVILVFLGILLVSFASAVIPSGCSSSMVAYFKFDGNINNDYTSTSSYVSMTGSSGISYTTNDFKVKKAAIFSDDPQTIIDSISNRKMNFASINNGFTIEFWFKDDSATSSNGNIISNSGYFVNVNGGTMTFTVRLSTPQSVSTSYVVGETHFYAFSFNPITRTLNIYRDGFVAATKTYGSSIPSTISSTQPTVEVMSLGTTGTIDELAFYNSALASSGQNSILDHFSLSNSNPSKNYCDNSAGEFSSTSSEFTIAGCKGTTVDGVEFSVAKGSCSRDGYYYCGDDEVLYDTLNDVDACSMKRGSYSVGGEMCCPSKYVCDSNTLTCDFPNVECPSYSNSNDCSDNGCYWLNEGSLGKCITSPSEYGCSIYTSSQSCIQDTYNVGSAGFGTEVCSPDTGLFSLSIGDFVVPTSSCKCIWDTATSKCELSWTFTEGLRSATTNNYDQYDCWTDFSFGVCLDGEQEVSWSTQVKNNVGPNFGLGVLDEAKTVPGCVGGNLVRDCGDPIINLPGISPLSVLLVVVFLTVFYYKRRNDL